MCLLPYFQFVLSMHRMNSLVWGSGVSFRISFPRSIFAQVTQIRSLEKRLHTESGCTEVSPLKASFCKLTVASLMRLKTKRATALSLALCTFGKFCLSKSVKTSTDKVSLFFYAVEIIENLASVPKLRTKGNPKKLISNNLNPLFTVLSGSVGLDTTPKWRWNLNS